MSNQFSKIPPELQQAAKMSPTFTASRKNLWFIRSLMFLMPPQKIPNDSLVENIHIPGQDGRTKIRLRTYKPKSISAPIPVLLWLHGGGYVIGRPEMDDRSCVEYVIARRLIRKPALIWRRIYELKLGPVDLSSTIAPIYN